MSRRGLCAAVVLALVCLQSGCGLRDAPEAPVYELALGDRALFSGLLPRTMYQVEVSRDGRVEYRSRGFSDEHGKLSVTPGAHQWDFWSGGRVAVYRLPDTVPVSVIDVPPIRGEVALGPMLVCVEGVNPSSWVDLTVGRDAYRTLSTAWGHAYFDLADHYHGPDALARAGPIVLSQRLDSGEIRTLVHEAAHGLPGLAADLITAGPHGDVIDPEALPVGVRSTMTVTVTDEVGRPVAGAEVWASWTGATLRTDSRGMVSLGITPGAGGAARIIARAPGYAPAAAHAAALGRSQGLVEVLVPAAHTMEEVAAYLVERDGTRYRIVDSIQVTGPACDRILLVGPSDCDLVVLVLAGAGHHGWRWEREVRLDPLARESVILSVDDPGLIPLRINATVGEGSLDIGAALEAVDGPNPPELAGPVGEIRGSGTVTFHAPAGEYRAHVHGHIEDAVGYVFAARPVTVGGAGTVLGLSAVPEMVESLRVGLPADGYLSGIEFQLPYSRVRGQRILIEPDRYRAIIRLVVTQGHIASGWSYVFEVKPGNLTVLPGSPVDLSAGDTFSVGLEVESLREGGTFDAGIVFSGAAGTVLREVRSPQGTDIQPLYRLVDRSGRIVLAGTGTAICIPWPPEGSDWVLEVGWDTGPLAGVVRAAFVVEVLMR